MSGGIGGLRAEASSSVYQGGCMHAWVGGAEWGAQNAPKAEAEIAGPRGVELGSLAERIEGSAQVCWAS